MKGIDNKRIEGLTGGVLRFRLWKWLGVIAFVFTLGTGGVVMSLFVFMGVGMSPCFHL